MGSRGPDVVKLQQLLNAKVHPSPRLVADGNFGPKTLVAVKTFQSQHHLTADGIVGPQTWGALEAGGPAPPHPGGGGQPPSGAGAPKIPINLAGAKINQEGLNMVMSFEGLRLTAYQDSVGVWTIGWGHTGPDVKPGLTITRDKAESLLRQDLSRFEAGVSRLVKAPISSNQFSALVSFSYNVGLGALGSSTLLRLLNQGNYQGAADQFPVWDKAGGQVLAGLAKRRAAERALFLKA
jgi:lysozyme